MASASTSQVTLNAEVGSSSSTPSTSSTAPTRPASANPSSKPKTTPWARKLQERQRLAAMKTKEREMKAEVEAIKERRRKKQEKERLGRMAEKMSAKRLERKKKKMGIANKKVAH
ncbi:hypothetical protein BDZ90DRAFT_73689 [Jaminaea rosea]|uniref:rRNA-processing protein n=1 Tax=Jaminaea rosea TaxID=1569628 RepID=A0A316UK95_9BASI|nr:hypothetical protein BDZ90DRAFT_73689 [Jaminaea rosea]PWN25354.1 hypothetical protein BDZ90DRAFT_73689 [Jaminaea rosea]